MITLGADHTAYPIISNLIFSGNSRLLLEEEDSNHSLFTHRQMEWKPDVVNKTFFVRLNYLVHQREWRPVDTGGGLSG